MAIRERPVAKHCSLAGLTVALKLDEHSGVTHSTELNNAPNHQHRDAVGIAGNTLAAGMTNLLIVVASARRVIPLLFSPFLKATFVARGHQAHQIFLLV
jgi:hypothetical protein